MKETKKVVIEGIPYQKLFNRWGKTEKWANILVWIAGILSIISVCWGYFPEKLAAGQNIIETLNCFVMVAGIAVTLLANIYSGSVAEYERVGGFIDDAFETKILEKPLNYEYYTNGIVQKGTVRMAANCFENCFFTENISKGMTVKIVIKNIVFLVLFVALAFLNFTTENVSALFQLLISSVLLEELIKHLYFRHSIHALFERFKSLYDAGITDELKFQAQATYMVIKYEKALSYYNQMLDSNLYHKLNPALSKDWEEMKERYEIVTNKFAKQEA